MDETKLGISGSATPKSRAVDYVSDLVEALQEPVLVIDSQFIIINANSEFYTTFNLNIEDVLEKDLSKLNIPSGDFQELQRNLGQAFSQKKNFRDLELKFPTRGGDDRTFRINGAYLENENQIYVLLSFKKDEEVSTVVKNDKNFLKTFNNILSHAPAYICTLKGPEHTFEVANENYFKLVGNRDILGKRVKEIIPEVVSQGFINLLDNVYSTGEAFIGNEIPIKLEAENGEWNNSFLNFVYQPTRNSRGDVDGIFVHAIDVTEQVEARKLLENSEKRLQKLIDTVPAMIWITNKDGESVYLNDNWYSYTGQAHREAEGFGWLKAAHPDDMQLAEDAFRKASESQTAYNVSFRLRNQTGDYRWVIDRGSPKFNEDGKFEGMVGTVMDVHEEKLKEQLIRESEHRIRNIVEEATVATGIYVGKEMKIELANEAMIKLWGKSFSVIGKTLKEALPELEGQPFHKLLDEVYTTGKTYWGKEDKVDLEINGKLQSGYYNFTYKPLRNENGEIYGILNMAVDVTELVRSKMVVKESEVHFRQMADLMPTKVTNADASGNFIYFNQGWLDFSGLTLEEIRASGWEQFIHPEQKEIFSNKWKRSLETGEKLEMEIKFRELDGIYTWHIHRAEPVKDEEGKIKMWIGATISIQEQKKVMESLEYSKALLETHNQANLDGVLLVDTKGNILSFNQRFIDIWNMPPEIIEARNDKAALKFAEKQLISADNFLRDVNQIYASPNQYCKDELKFSDGKIIERHGYPVVGEDGTFYAWSWTFRDITLQKNQEKSIKESELYYRQMADLMPTKVSNANAAGDFIYYNQSWLDYTGLSFDELKKEGWIRLIHPEDKKEFEEKWKWSLESGENFEMELRCHNKSGKYKWHLSRTEPVRNVDGDITMWISTNTEIQKLKEEENRKGDFLKMVSHELKTPVTSIKGYVQLLLTMLRKEESGLKVNSLPLKPSLERIDHQIKRLTRLISEMLDLSRIEENKLELKKQVFNLNELVDETVQDIRYTNTQHNLEIIHDFNCEVLGDKDRIGQVLINFITNAIKYSPENKDIVIRIAKHKDKQVSVSVKDQGIGIEKKNHKNIFKRFYRVGGKDEETYSGFGIGLYLAKEIIERHNGLITVKSKKGKGSEFCLILSSASEN